MLLKENFTQRIKNYNTLKKFNVSTEKITNVCFRVILKLMSTEIWIDTEETETYVSFLIQQKKDGKTNIYSALADYSYVKGDRLPIFSSKKEEEKFNARVIQAQKNGRKVFLKDKNGDGIVICILSFLDEFVNKLL